MRLNPIALYYRNRGRSNPKHNPSLIPPRSPSPMVLFFLICVLSRFHCPKRNSCTRSNGREYTVTKLILMRRCAAKGVAATTPRPAHAANFRPTAQPCKGGPVGLDGPALACPNSPTTYKGVRASREGTLAFVTTTTGGTENFPTKSDGGRGRKRVTPIRSQISTTNS